MKPELLFATLRRKREYERAQLPFMHSLVDFDIIIEIGFHQELSQPITLKQLLLLSLASGRTTRRRLDTLVASGAVLRRRKAGDHRAAALTLSATTLRTMEKYGSMLQTFAHSSST